MWRSAVRGVRCACESLSGSGRLHVAFSEAAAQVKDAAPFKVSGLNHVAVAVPSLDSAIQRFESLLGVRCSLPQPQPAHGVTVSFISLPNIKIELLEPLGSSSPISRFLERNPDGGVHHLCLDVDDVLCGLSHAKKHVRALDPVPKTGSHGVPVAFLHPKDTNGVLLELQQSLDGSDRSSSLLAVPASTNATPLADENVKRFLEDPDDGDDVVVGTQSQVDATQIEDTPSEPGTPLGGSQVPRAQLQTTAFRDGEGADVQGSQLRDEWESNVVDAPAHISSREQTQVPDTQILESAIPETQVLISSSHEVQALSASGHTQQLRPNGGSSADATQAPPGALETPRLGQYSPRPAVAARCTCVSSALAMSAVPDSGGRYASSPATPLPAQRECHGALTTAVPTSSVLPATAQPGSELGREQPDHHAAVVAASLSPQPVPRSAWKRRRRWSRAGEPRACLSSDGAVHGKDADDDSALRVDAAEAGTSAAARRRDTSSAERELCAHSKGLLSEEGRSVRGANNATQSGSSEGSMAHAHARAGAAALPLSGDGRTASLRAAATRSIGRHVATQGREIGRGADDVHALAADDTIGADGQEQRGSQAEGVSARCGETLSEATSGDRKGTNPPHSGALHSHERAPCSSGSPARGSQGVHGAAGARMRKQPSCALAPVDGVGETQRLLFSQGAALNDMQEALAQVGGLYEQLCPESPSASPACSAGAGAASQSKSPGHVAGRQRASSRSERSSEATSAAATTSGGQAARAADGAPGTASNAERAEEPTRHSTCVDTEQPPAVGAQPRSAAGALSRSAQACNSRAVRSSARLAHGRGTAAAKAWETDGAAALQQGHGPCAAPEMTRDGEKGCGPPASPGSDRGSEPRKEPQVAEAVPSMDGRCNTAAPRHDEMDGAGAAPHVAHGGRRVARRAACRAVGAEPAALPDAATDAVVAGARRSARRASAPLRFRESPQKCSPADVALHAQRHLRSKSRESLRGRGERDARGPRTARRRTAASAPTPRPPAAEPLRARARAVASHEQQLMPASPPGPYTQVAAGALLDLMHAGDGASAKAAARTGVGTIEGARGSDEAQKGAAVPRLIAGPDIGAGAAPARTRRGACTPESARGACEAAERDLKRATSEARPARAPRRSRSPNGAHDAPPDQARPLKRRTKSSASACPGAPLARPVRRARAAPGARLGTARANAVAGAPRTPRRKRVEGNGAAVLVSPKRERKAAVVLLSSSSVHGLRKTTRERAARMGVTIMTSSDDALTHRFTHFVCDELRVSAHLLLALANGCPVVTREWLEASVAAGTVLGARNFLCVDPKFEREHGMTMEGSWAAAQAGRLLEGHVCYITEDLLELEEREQKDGILLGLAAACAGRTGQIVRTASECADAVQSHLSSALTVLAIVRNDETRSRVRARQLPCNCQAWHKKQFVQAILQQTFTHQRPLFIAK